MIETERLLLRMPRAEDAPALAAAYADLETVRYIGDGSTATLAEVEDVIPQWLERWESWGVGFFSVERREDGLVLGRSGFLRWDPETWQVGGSETELGWLIAREHWGHGYATEAALALRDWAFGERGLTRLISLIQHGNERSVRVAEKIGEQLEGDVVVRGNPSWLYSVER
jgi:RimJ/RimL family protein N-acetyltransferase